ncbi:hypothetical protein IFM89_020893 [Coptis chinensis]|uniref:Uncharacterized protein n=1 Tax=Coptis chinensis TaxID=261450 RepID=A0A835HTY9_9MAGN|nr:hypothetical protein IFM89_020893 [Coptis chinensis]
MGKAMKQVLEVGDGVFEVLSTFGDTHLGGDDFDKRVVDWLALSFKRDEGGGKGRGRGDARESMATKWRLDVSKYKVCDVTLSLSFLGEEEAAGGGGGACCSAGDDDDSGGLRPTRCLNQNVWPK